MDIKELNEAIGRALNETSDTAVNAVADKRKDAFDKKSMKEDEGFKVGDFVFSRAHFRYGYIKDFDGRLYTVEFVCSVYGAEEMATTDSVAPAYLEDGNIRLDSEIADLERQWAAQKKIKEKFANKVTNESVADKKSMKEEMEYNRRIWDIFEENIAEYLKEHGVKPEGNNVMKYISKNAREIVEAVLNKEYNYEEDVQAIFELYYNCPIHFTDKVQAINNLLEEYLAESLKRCLTIEDKLTQLSSLDKNESVIEKKSMKEEKESFETVLIDDRYLIYPDGVVYDTEEAKDIPSYVFKIRDKIIG